jgi:hypothetical protein
MQHDTDDRNYERHLLVHQKMLMCLLKSVPFQIWTFLLPEFDEIVAHPALLIPQKIPVDEDTILPYFPNPVEAVPGEFNAPSFVMALNIQFHELQARVALHIILPHSINISLDQSDPYDIPNDTFCNSQIIVSHKCIC